MAPSLGYLSELLFFRASGASSECRGISSRWLASHSAASLLPLAMLSFRIRVINEKLYDGVVVDVEYSLQVLTFVVNLREGIIRPCRHKMSLYSE